MSNKKTKQYDETSIQILEGLDAVRKRPAMYIGSTDQYGLHHLVWEIIDNAIDEALNGYGDKIMIRIHEDGSLEVEDFARGMPVGLHQSGKNATEVIFTILHAGGKFSEQGGYKNSGGLHGVGASVVNALSSWLEVTIYSNDGYIYKQRFEDGAKIIKPMKKLSKSTRGLTGSIVRFKPNEKLFSTVNFSYTRIVERLRESAFLLKGIEIQIEDLRKGKKEIFKFDDGLKSFIEFLNEKKQPLHKIVTFEGNTNEIDVECSFQFINGYQENILSFANMVKTNDGGTHETGLKTALTKIFNDYARKYNLLKQKEPNLDGKDVREGLTAIVSVKIPEHILQFEGQTKAKLGTPIARNAVETVVSEKLQYFLEENKEIADNLIKKMVQASQARSAARKAREASRKGTTSRQERILSGKLAPAQSKDKNKKELYLVEGDSAGGSAKQGRDRKYQAILPLRGKVVNTEKTALSEALKNEEIATIINTIGAGIGNEFDADDSQYSKVIIMTDADTDGAHIQVLLLTFFYRYMTDLIKSGKVYIALPPLYKVFKGSGKNEKFVYCWSDEELDDAKKEIGRGYSIQRYKGLGEMNAPQLWDTTMNPETRTLIQVDIKDNYLADKNVSILMGDKVAPRREWIEENVQFSLEDQFTLEK